PTKVAPRLCVPRGAVVGLRLSGLCRAVQDGAVWRTEPVVLLFLESHYSPAGQEIVAVLEAGRFRYQAETAATGLKPTLTRRDGAGRFAAVVFENVHRYAAMDAWNRELLDRYCLEFAVGIVAFLRVSDGRLLAPLVATHSLVFAVLSRPASLHLSLSLFINFPSPLGDPGGCVHQTVPYIRDLTLFIMSSDARTPDGASEDGTGRHAAAVYGAGTADDGAVRRVFFGNGVSFWLHKLLFLDALAWCSPGPASSGGAAARTARRLALPLDRYILVDVDDIFVGKEGTRMTPADVE
uniref:Uncharacterized protein n=1 Tax=Petromyzon marinus TaxID=7757 RepID=S4RCH2_PETMA